MPITPQQVQAASAVQQRAARDTSPQVRIVAGPGTGKSYAIQDRVLWLISRGVAPREIFVVSFTRASARDLRTRIHDHCVNRGVPAGCSVSVSTLHSLALRALRAAGLLTAYPTDPTVMDEWELKNIFDREFSNVSGLPAGRCEDIREYHEAFWSTGTWAPPNYIPPAQPITRSEQSSFNTFHGPRTQVYSCVLPGEIVLRCLQHASAHTFDPAAQLGMEHLVVDEYQDLNPVDLEFTDVLIQSATTALVAGDDDQSIYSFRFASPQGIQDFRGKYPQLGDHVLGDCFRCTPQVLATANSVVARHPLPNRIQKRVTSLYQGANPPIAGSVHCWQFASGAAEARAIAESCRDLIVAGVDAGEIMVLISNRTALERELTSAFQALGVPYEPPRSDGYTESEDGRLALAYLRIACNGDDYVAHRTLVGLQPGVGPGTCNNIADAVLQNNLNYRDLFYRPLPPTAFRGRELRALNATRAVLQQTRQWSPSDTLGQRDAEIRRAIEAVLGPAARHAWAGYTSHLPPDITIEELRDCLWADTSAQQEQILSLVYQRLGLPPPHGGLLPPRVRMMTMHGAKGLDGHVVFIPGLEEEILPGQWRRPYPGLVLEAARLLYVSVSRAQASCIVSYANQRFMYGRAKPHTPSQFAPSLGTPFVGGRAGGLTQPEVLAIAADCRLL